MSFAVLVEAQEGQFAASVAGAPNVRVVQPTRSLAIAALRSEIQQRVEIGEMLSLEILPLRFRPERPAVSTPRAKCQPPKHRAASACELAATVGRIGF